MITPAGKYGLIVRFELKLGHEEAFDDLAAETLKAISRFEPGTIVYMTHQEIDAPAVRVFYELYQDYEAFQAHEAMPHIRRFLDERAQHLSRDPTSRSFDQPGGTAPAG
jgi:quinol monooxygenase YgiN